MKILFKLLMISILFTSLSPADYIQGWKIISIRQPVLADPNSTFNVPITVVLNIIDTGAQKRVCTPQKGSGKWYFGMRLPKGWAVEESISFLGALNGSFIYSSENSDSMDTYEKPHDGYYWWIGVSDSVDSLFAGKLSYTPRITTDEQSGTFFIDYIISDSIGIFSFDDSRTHENHKGSFPISVGMPMTTIMVSNTDDNGEESLRHAINEVGLGGEIKFDLSYPANIELDSQIIIDRNITITGPDSGKLTISGKNQSRIFLINRYLSVNISNLVIKNGRADNPLNDNGGGICCYHSNLNLENVTISNCYSSGWGGGLRFADGYLELTNVKISNNEARLYGGGFFVQHANVNISNSEFTSNPVEFYDCYAFMNNVTIIDGGILIAGYGFDLINSIIWYNPEHPILAHNEPSIGYLNIANSNIQGGLDKVWINDFYTLYWLTGNIDLDPMFMDAENSDYRLQEGSPCIDAGIQDTLIVYNNGHDTLFIPQMDYVGSAPDIGAYEFGVTTEIEEQTEIPNKISLSQNYPNPFNPSTAIEFTMPHSEFTTLKVLNILGKEVSTLVSKKLNPGNHTYQFEGKNLASGVYYYQLVAGEYREVKKMILLR